MLFRDLSFTMLPGAIIYLRGDNGSGKSSLLRILAGLQSPTIGRVLLQHQPIESVRKPCVVYIGHELGINLGLSVQDNLLFWARIYGSLELLEVAILYFNLESFLSLRAQQLSAGNKQKLVLARLMLNRSNLWLLDEVNNNMDAKNKLLFEQLVVSKAHGGGMIVIATHGAAFTDKCQSINMSDYV